MPKFFPMHARRSRPRLPGCVSRIAGVVLAWLVAAVGAAAQPAPRLPALALRADAVTVSGLSSGAYMAGQFQVAYAASVSGAAILAGGPYGCSRGNVGTAALKCSCPAEPTYALSLASQLGMGCFVHSAGVYEVFAERALQANRDGIDDPVQLARHRVWLFSGGQDPVVARPLVEAAASFYARHGVPAAQLHHEHRADAGHGFPAPTARLGCGVTAQPFLIDCEPFDAAGALLRWLYPDLPPAPVPARARGLRRYAQSPYAAGAIGLDTTGWLYVPAACEQPGSGCRLHVVFHGCEQGQSFRLPDGRRYGRQFVDGAGYQRWAEAGGIVVLYPQLRAGSGGTPLSSHGYNPKGCWDFWGYSTDSVDTDPLRFARRDAPQMRAVKAMVDALLRAP